MGGGRPASATHGRAGGVWRSRHAHLLFVPPFSVSFVTGEVVAPSSGECGFVRTARESPCVAVSAWPLDLPGSSLVSRGGGRVPGSPPSLVLLGSVTPGVSLPPSVRSARATRARGAPRLPPRDVSDEPTHSPHAAQGRCASWENACGPHSVHAQLCSGRARPLSSHVWGLTLLACAPDMARVGGARVPLAGRCRGRRRRRCRDCAVPPRTGAGDPRGDTEV